MTATPNPGPHQSQPVAEAGAPLHRAKAAMVLVHGRGASAQSILSLADAFAQPEVAYFAPQAGGYTWYPYSFLAPLKHNEPGISSGLQAIGDVLAQIEAGGIAARQTVVLGFSQGACLALEFAARRGQALGGAVAFSGGLIGNVQQNGSPPDDKGFDYTGDLQQTPVFLGCSDIDPHIPVARVHQSADVFSGLGADVTKRIYEGMEHTINDDEVRFVRGLLARLVAAE